MSDIEQLIEAVNRLSVKIDKLQADFLLMKYSTEAKLDEISASTVSAPNTTPDPLAGDPMMRFTNPMVEKL